MKFRSIAKAKADHASGVAITFNTAYALQEPSHFLIIFFRDLHIQSLNVRFQSLGALRARNRNDIYNADFTISNCP